MNCRHCRSELKASLIDLGTSPPSNAYLNASEIHEPEKWFPLRVLICENCWLVQTEDFSRSEELFSEDYAYFSSFSSTWLQHAESYVGKMIERFSLDQSSNVVEIAANDGYLLQYVKKNGIPCTGVEPTKSTAEAARKKGIPIIEEFFGENLASKMRKLNLEADLTVANNVLAHVPDINDFVKGFSILLKENGVSTFEFPHLLNLLKENQFDTIYHEHYSYLSLYSVSLIFESNGLSVFDVEELNTHGGSLRVFAQRRDTGKHPVSDSVSQLIQKEISEGINSLEIYKSFQQKVNRVKNDLLTFLIKSKNEQKKVVGYGAAAKGNTLINYSGIRSDLLEFVVDKNPAKQNKFLPGSRIPIKNEDDLIEAKPDYILILPWNLTTEVINQLDYITKWNGKFVSAVPELKII